MTRGMREVKPQVSYSFGFFFLVFFCCLFRVFLVFVFVASCMIRPCQKFLLLVQLCVCVYVYTHTPSTIYTMVYMNGIKRGTEHTHT